MATGFPITLLSRCVSPNHNRAPLQDKVLVISVRAQKSVNITNVPPMEGGFFQAPQGARPHKSLSASIFSDLFVFPLLLL